MLPIFSNTMKLLKNYFSELVTVIHVAPNKHVEDYISRVIHKWPVPVILIPGGSPQMKYDAFSVRPHNLLSPMSSAIDRLDFDNYNSELNLIQASRVALCTSGTAAVELQLAQLPCIVAYRAHFLTEWLICYKAKVPYISLPNILLDSSIIPEALFQACTPTKL